MTGVGEDGEMGVRVLGMGCKMERPPANQSVEAAKVKHRSAP